MDNVCTRTRSSHTCRHNAGQGFTLIELMVVCAIIGIIAAIILPILGRAVGKKKKTDDNAVAMAPSVSKAPRASATLRATAKGLLPTFTGEEIHIALSTREHRIGMDVYTRFEANYRGQFVLLHTGSQEEITRLSFPFPEDTTEARDVSLKLSSGGGELAEPPGVVYDEEGIFWVGSLPVNTPVKAEVSFIAQGRDRFAYRLPAAGRTRAMQLSLAIQGHPAIVIPDHALQPTSTASEQIVWKFNNLVSDRAIIVELPGAQSPLGRMMLLCKLVGMAVLLFGAGFWYLSELYQPGLLHAFRWAHFFLLALTYSLFFVVFGVLGFRGETTTLSAIAIAALLSLPLLMLHVARVIHAHFAFTRTLPLAIFTLGLVINGVYGDQWRDYVFIGAVFACIAFVTVTFRRWAAHREAWVKTLESRLIEKIKAFAGQITAAQEVGKTAETTLGESDPAGSSGLRTTVENSWKYLTKQCQEYDNLALDAAKMASTANIYQRDYLRSSLGDRLSLLENCLQEAKNSLHTALTQLTQSREALKVKRPAHTGKTHCPNCGCSGESTPFCSQCGTQRPLVMVCPKCGDHLPLLLHLMDKNQPKNKMHCLSCGELYK